MIAERVELMAIFSRFKQADPCSLVVFGASGDLMHRLLVPALYNLAAGGLSASRFTARCSDST
jgi:glucose-6-phosphate 1-dehydrogenase